MWPLGVVGPGDADTGRVVERLVSHLANRGNVAVITRDRPRSDDQESVPDGRGELDSRPVPDIDRYRTTGAGVAYDLDGNGEWAAAGEGTTLPDLLDRLAPRYDYVVVEGVSEASIPQVVLGETDHEGRAIQEVPDADAVDPETVARELEATEPHETLSSLVARAEESPDADRAGAVATFTGRVRARDDPDDAPTEFLEFEKYEGVADDRLATIREELEARDGVFEVLLHHRTGVVERDEDIVFVVVLAGHREEAFRTVEDGIDRLKDEVPIFKREVTVEEEFWVHHRE